MAGGSIDHAAQAPALRRADCHADAFYTEADRQALMRAMGR